MTAEKGAKKNHKRRARVVARDGSIGCSCESEQLQQNLKKTHNQNAFNDVIEFQFFKEKRLDQDLHRKHQKKQKITWSSHVIFD